MVKSTTLRLAVLAIVAGLVAAGVGAIRSRGTRGERDKRAELIVPCGLFVDARPGGVAVAVAEHRDEEAYQGTGWALLFHQDALPTQRIASGEGLPLAVWLSPDSNQVLFGWIGRTGDSAGLRKVALFDTVGEKVSPITEVSGQLLTPNLFGVSPWSRDGTHWLSLVQGGGNVIYGGGKPEQLRAVARALKAWLSDRPGRGLCA